MSEMPASTTVATSIGRAYDAVIVGARAAGAATALLLARAGLRVLVIDRGAYGTDTLSTHALMRGGVVQLHNGGCSAVARRYAGHPLDELLLSRRHPSHPDQAATQRHRSSRRGDTCSIASLSTRPLPPERSCASASRSSTSRVTTDGSRACDCAAAMARPSTAGQTSWWAPTAATRRSRGLPAPQRFAKVRTSPV